MNEKRIINSVAKPAKPADKRPMADRPAVAAAIVFSPIAISIILLIVYVLSHTK